MNLRIDNLCQSKSIENLAFDHSTKEGRTAYCRAHRAAYPNHYRDKELRKNFGITLSDYEMMLGTQGGVCAICAQPERGTLRGKLKRLAVDHDHATGKIRALLCSNCNPMIGYAGDEPTLLRKAAEYIETHRKGATILPFPTKESG